MMQQAILSKRCKVEHNYAVIKNIFNFKYTRVRGIAKNAARFFILATLSNFYKLTRQTRDKSVLL
ncbi:MAG: transposase [Lachnospirales bacterium]